MVSQAQVVIIGSGIAGSSIAYHLSELGWKEIVVLEQGELISGTTSHPPGLVGQLRSSTSLIRLLMSSVSLYKELNRDGNEEAGYTPVGSLRLASSRTRLEELKRQLEVARQAGLPAELVGPAEAHRLFSIMSLESVEGALFLPTDGSARAPILARAMADRARRAGVTFHAHTQVTGFEMNNGRVRAVLTNQGRVQTEIAVIAAGIWSPRLGRMAGVRIPLVPMQHQFAMTEPLPELGGAGSLANMRDPDNLVYFRQDGASLVIGGYEHDPAPLEVEAIPNSNNPTIMPFDPPRFQPLLEGSYRRIPRLKQAGLVKQVNGLESFTPDGAFLVGEAPEVRGCWVACGFCAHGVSGGGGVGKLMAEWIVTGKPSLDVREMDIRRFASIGWSDEEIKQRTLAVYRAYYGLQPVQTD
jgi:sarcosine dehydrogenase